MKKLILTAAIVFTAGILSLMNTKNTNPTTSVKTAKVILDNRNILATAD